MHYTRVLLVQRQEELEQQLLLAETASERIAIDNELVQVEAALEDLKEVVYTTHQTNKHTEQCISTNHK